ncbi:hypothetical protein [Falsihalocynthiibacter sp. CO-5D18]|uniref:phage tail tape measure protein n=1 Tax=Falsihalocynthiibacter sp. CO-5D18 TaxID=3240872 RepID=UPI00350F98CC
MTQEILERTVILDVDARRMQASLDAAEKELGTLVKQFDRAQAAGKRYQNTANKTASNVIQMNRSIKNTSNIAQQASYQLSDFFVQIEGGTSVSRAFSQQFSQIAPLMGTVGIGLAVLVPLMTVIGPKLFEMAGGSNEAAAATEKLNKQVADAIIETADLNDQLILLRSGYRSISELALQTNLLNLRKELLEVENKIVASNNRSERNQQTRIDKAREAVQVAEDSLKAYQQSADALAAAKQNGDGLAVTMDQVRIEAYATRDAFINMSTAASAAADEWLAIQTLKSRFAGEDLAMGQTVVSVGQGDPITKDKPEGSKSGGGSAVKTIDKIAEAAKAAEEAAKAAEEAFDAWFESLGVGGRMIEHTLTAGVSGFVDALFDAEKSFAEFARSFLIEIGKMIAQQLIFNMISGAMGGSTSGASAASILRLASGVPVPSAKGNAFSGGNVVPFANGGIVSAPAIFPMSGGKTGLMGEAGPEAIIPLSRGADGKLGVSGQSVVVNVTNQSGSQVQVNETEAGVDIIISRAIEGARQDFVRSMSTGQGAYARSLEQGYQAKRKAY